ncbi:sensor histidine kinase [Frateuria sp. MAH-13]|uniref:Sensor histidine kinase n=1 Tax=Frateuria flava TaxID=2821489 RepID=A0ABS4DM99_9GAMM|nr:sensor histidine kinase [Frateuria flava]MBP1474177.1 sensor histidine kinase [Frateuria flava]
MRPLRAWFTPAPDSRIAEIRRQGKSPWAESVHLLWSAWVFITPVFDNQYSWRWLGLTVLTYPVFVVLFAKVFLASRSRAPTYALALALFGLVLVPIYPSGVSYFIYGCVSCSLSSRRFLPFLARLLVLNTLFLLMAWQAHYAWQAMLAIPCMTLIIGLVTHVERLEHEKDAALKLSHDEVRRLAATAERERIGRDLHDLLGHTLSLITLKLELSRKLFDRDTEAARREVIEAENVARHALAQVRSAVTGIRATDLAAELASARLLLESSGVHLDYDQPPCLPAETERGLSLVLREAATNIARHAAATCAHVAFECIDGGLCLTIADNGRGGVLEEGNGLTGMRERVRALGGRLQIHSQQGQGTRLRVVVPLPASAMQIAAAPAAPVDSLPMTAEARP